ncbi:ABC transporter permease [Paenibacillus sp. FSL H7-0331]|uniref:ABC transporter permease n=1 Tax=Paenibacillus sp. FSL H7-0331 TaxID=1920421 RepID=UPI00096E0DC9|nr:ABC transporter permease [Paenibacillus sp. FSL H7-0331]OMF20527.1 spermidine/putrescine ABC transporter permease [Paenibacillus sp. FSL H7-0331]
MKKKYVYLLMLPGLLFLTLFMLVPIIMTIGTTFFQKGNFTFNGYMHFLQDQYFLNILLTTMQVSTVTTILCILIGFPVAYYVSRQSPRTKGIMLALAIFPLLTSSVVRSFSWIIILGKNGLLNSSLMSLGLIQQPLEILYTPTAVMIGLIHLFLPLIIISLVGVMENIDPDLVKAAESLGASRFTVFRKVIFPLSIPGLILGSILVFVGSMTAYTTPSVLGGKKRVISTFLYQNAITLNDWYSASVVATIMMVITLIVIGLMTKISTKLSVKG